MGNTITVVPDYTTKALSGTHEASSIADILKDDLEPRLPGSGTLAISTDPATALDAAISSAPTEKSLRDTLHKDGSFTFDNTTDSLEMLSDKIGAFSGDGGAAADDSVKAILDLIKANTDNANLVANNLDHLQKVATGSADMTTEVTDGSVISRILSKTSDTSSYDPTTDSLEAIRDSISSISVLTNAEKARLHLGWHQQVPLIETWKGILDAPACFADNSAITDTQVAEWCSRYDGAPAWARRDDNSGDSSIASANSYATFLQMYPNGAGRISAVCALQPFMISGPVASTFFPNDERLIFECILAVDSMNNNMDAATTFFGLAVASPEADWGATDYGSTAHLATYHRVGFISSGSADKNLVPITNGASNITSVSAFTPGITVPHHYKFIYDIGTGVEFFLDGVSLGSSTTNLPVSGTGIAPDNFLVMFWLKDVSAAPQNRLHAVRCYWQNGA